MKIKYEMDYYKSLSEEQVNLLNAQLINSDGVFEDVLKRITDGKISSNPLKIELILGIPKDIKDSVCDAFNITFEENDEAYAVIISSDGAKIFSETKGGLLFGCYALLRECEDGMVNCGIIYNYPKTSHRAVKVFLPSRNNMEFFKNFVEFISFYGCNAIVIETGGAIEYKSHPEVNEGWEEYCRIFEEYQGKTIDVQNSYGWKKNSIHFENGGGSYLTHEEVRELVLYCKKYFLNVIPEVPSLSHSDYLLTRHPELAERREDPLPNTYCPSNPETYKLLFDILDETIEVFEPETVNIAHDEWYSIGLCDKCKGKDAADLYADDVNKIYNYLKERGIRTIMWGDKLLNAISKEGYHYGGSHIEYKTEDGREYVVPETYKSIDKIPNDIEIYNWYWRLTRDYDKEFLSRGFKVYYANFRPMQIFDIKERMEGKISGYCISNWSSLDPVHIQRNGIFAAVAYAADMFWNHSFDENDFKNNFIRIASGIFNYHYEIMNKGKYAYVIHATDEERPHKEFVDGYLMDYDKDYLGKYKVTYTDGTFEEKNVYFCLNIGIRSAVMDREEAFDSDMYNLKPYFYEPTYTCEYVEENDGLYYKMPVLPAEGKTIAGITLAEGGEKIKIKSVIGINGETI